MAAARAGHSLTCDLCDLCVTDLYSVTSVQNARRQDSYGSSPRRSQPELRRDSLSQAGSYSGEQSLRLCHDSRVMTRRQSHDSQSQTRLLFLCPCLPRPTPAPPLPRPRSPGLGQPCREGGRLTRLYPEGMSEV